EVRAEDDDARAVLLAERLDAGDDVGGGDGGQLESDMERSVWELRRRFMRQGDRRQRELAGASGPRRDSGGRVGRSWRGWFARSSSDGLAGIGDEGGDRACRILGQAQEERRGSARLRDLRRASDEGHRVLVAGGKV